MYKAIVIGAGSIGAWKDDKYDSPITENILTHAHAYYSNPDIELEGIIDSDSIKGTLASSKWNTDYYRHHSYMDYDPDIISVCTPTKTHKEILLDIIEAHPKIVIAEKPFCNNSKEAQEVKEVYEKAGIPIMINYPRDYVPEIIQLDSELNNGKYGKIYSAIFYYTRGLKHEGCHAIDLCRFLFGEYRGGKANRANCIKDRDENDPTVGAWMTFERCPHVFFSPCDGRQYKVFQLEIMTEKGKIILSQHGMYIDFYPLIEEPIWGGFQILSKDLRYRKPTQLNKSLEFLLKEAVTHLHNMELNKFDPNQLTCNADDALQVHKIIEHLRGE